MEKSKNKIITKRQELYWFCIYYALDDIQSYWNIRDDKFYELFNQLFDYVESKINPLEKSGEIVDEYVMTKYREFK